MEAHARGSCHTSGKASRGPGDQTGQTQDQHPDKANARTRRRLSFPPRDVRSPSPTGRCTAEPASRDSSRPGRYSSGMKGGASAPSALLPILPPALLHTPALCAKVSDSAVLSLLFRSSDRALASGWPQKQPEEVVPV